MDLENQIRNYIKQHDKFKDLLNELRRIVKSLDFQETLKWGIPTYIFDKKNLVAIGAFKNHVGLWFFQGALLKDKSKILHNTQEGKTKAMRQVHFKELSDIDELVLTSYLQETIENQKKGLQIKVSKPVKQVNIPAELMSSLEADSTLKIAFNNLTPGRKKEYIEYILSAKREQTKIDRLEKISPLIKTGKGLYDKYKSKS